MSEKNRQIVRMLASWAKRDLNARKDYGDETALKALARSRAKHQITPLVARSDGTLLDGYRTLRGLELEGMLDIELDFLIDDEAETPDAVTRIQLLSAAHRADLSPYDKASAIRDIKLANPGMSNRQIAEDVDLDGGYITKLLDIFDCKPQVQEAARDGKIGPSEWPLFAQARDQLTALQLRLSGKIKTRDALAAYIKQQDEPAKTEADTVKLKSIGIAMHQSKMVLLKGGVDLKTAKEMLTSALKLVDKAIEDGLTARSAQAMWKDTSKKTPGVKTPRKPRQKPDRPTDTPAN